MNKKDLVIVALATFCLTSTLFMILPSKSAEPYNPWGDVSGPTIGEPDGTINMRDINYEILRFNTFGDTTKNVTVTNLPAGFLNVTLADNLVMEGAYEFEADVAGYSRVTLVLWKGYEPFSMTMDINFQIGSLYTPSIYSNNTFTPEYQFLLKNYEVLGQKLHIMMYTSGPLTISLGLYATD